MGFTATRFAAGWGDGFTYAARRQSVSIYNGNGHYAWPDIVLAPAIDIFAFMPELPTIISIIESICDDAEAAAQYRIATLKALIYLLHFPRRAPRVILAQMLSN